MQDKKLIIDIHPVSPLIVKKGNSYVGFDIDIWEVVASRTNLNFEYKEVELGRIFTDLKNKKSDAAIAGLAINYEREKIVDFSHPYFESELVILTHKERHFSFTDFIKSILNSHSITWILYVFIFIIAAGHIFWLAERGMTLSQNYLPGIFESLWFAVVTVTTVGYGDMVPVEWVGRIVSIFLMLTGFILFGILTAHLASSIALHKIKSNITNSKDLLGKKVSAAKDSAGIRMLKESGAKVIYYQTFQEAYKKLKSGKIDAVVSDEPTVEDFLSRKKEKNIEIKTLEKQYYAIAFPKESKLRERINMAILSIKEDGTYQKIYKKWFDSK